MDNKINVLVLNVSLVEGMAGSMRVKNLVDPLYEKGEIYLSNLALTHTYEKHKIGEEGDIDGMFYKYVGYENPLNVFSIFKFYKQGFRFIKKNKKKGFKNVIYNYGYPDIKNLMFIYYAKSQGYKIIFDIVEDNRYAKKFSGFLGWLRMKSSIYLINKINKLSDAVIVISSHLEERLNKICMGYVEVYNIPITVDFKHFPDLNYKTDYNDIKIFYGGSFFLGKDGMEYLLEAFNQLSARYKNIKLILSGKSVVESEMRKIFNIIGGNPQVDYKGYLSVEEYYGTLNKCDIFCMPRNNSLLANAGFPFKLGEFLAAGRGIISTNVGDVPKFLNNMENAILIEPESTQQIADSIEYLINNKGEIERMGKAGIKVAKENFDSNILSQNFKDILVKI